MSASSIRFGKMSALNLAGNATRVALSFLTAIIASRSLGADGFGIVNLLLGYTVILNYILTLGFDSSLPYFIPKYSNENKHAMVAGIASFAIKTSHATAIAVMVLISISSPFILTARGHPELVLPFLLVAYQCFFWSQASVILGFLRGAKLFIPGILREQFLFPILQLVGIGILLYGYKLGVLGYAIGYLIGAFVCYLFALSSLRLIKKSVIGENSIWRTPWIKSPEWKQWFKFSVPLGLMTTLEPVMGWMSVIVAGWYLSNADVGIFAVGMRMMIFVQFIVLATAPILSTYLADYHHSGKTDSFKKMYQTLIFWSTLWSATISMVLISGAEFFLGIFGQDFKDGLLVIALLLPGFAAEGALGAAKQTLTMSGHNKINVANLGIVIGFNLILSIFLIPRYGASGAATALGLTYLLLNIIRVVQVQLFLKVAPLTRDSTKKIVLFLLLLTIIAVLLRQNIESDFSRAIVAVAIVVVLTIFSLTISIYKNENIRKLWHQFFAKHI